LLADMVTHGHAWAFVRYSRDYVEEEREAGGGAGHAGIQAMERGRDQGGQRLGGCWTNRGYRALTAPVSQRSWGRGAHSRRGAAAAPVQSAALGALLVDGHLPYLEMPLAGRPAFNAAQPRPIEDFILFRCGTIFHGEQATHSDPETSRHVANADAQVVAPAA
jgi:hypothetical protein